MQRSKSGEGVSSVGNLVSLGGKVPEFNIDTASVHGKVRSEEVARAVQGALRWMSGVDILRLPSISAHLASPDESGEAGTCSLQVVNLRGSVNLPILFIDAEFPKYLVRNGVPARQAVLGAAVMARSLDALHSLVMKTPGGTTFVGAIQDQESIRPEYWDQNMTLAQIGLFRASAALVIHTTGIDFDTMDRPPYPAHIAGLMNPLKISQK